MAAGLEVATVWLSCVAVIVVGVREVCDRVRLLLLVAVDRAGEGGNLGLQRCVVCHAREEYKSMSRLSVSLGKSVE